MPTAVVLLVAALALVAGRAAAADRPPNFVLIFTDDQGYGDLGCFGSRKLTTPRIDRLAEQGARLTAHYAAPVCTPARAALMTGCYPPRVGLGRGSRFGVLLDADPHGLNPDEATIAEVLRSGGYATGMFGKWHLGDQPSFLPTRHGFDVFLGLPYSHDVHPLNQPGTWGFPPLPMLAGEKIVEVDPDPDHFTRQFTDAAIEFIRAHRDEPFFVYLAHPLPHRPLHASDEFTAKLNPPPADDLPSYPKEPRDRLYPAAIEEIDHHVGRIVAVLDQLDLSDETLIVFTSDNGPAVGSSGPLRGGKGSALEGGVRVPCVARWPGRIPAGRTVDAVTSVMDWLPTFAALAGTEMPEDRAIDGHDITPLLLGESDQSPHDLLLYYQGDRPGAARMGPWKLYRGHQLYNLEHDIGERRDVSKAHPRVVTRIRTAQQRAHRELLENRRPVGRVENPRPLVPGSNGGTTKTRISKYETSTRSRRTE